MAQERDPAIAGDLPKARSELPERDVDRAVNLAGCQLTWLPDVDEDERLRAEACRCVFWRDRWFRGETSLLLLIR